MNEIKAGDIESLGSLLNANHTIVTGKQTKKNIWFVTSCSEYVTMENLFVWEQVTHTTWICRAIRKMHWLDVDTTAGIIAQAKSYLKEMCP